MWSPDSLTPLRLGLSDPFYLRSNHFHVRYSALKKIMDRSVIYVAKPTWAIAQAMMIKHPVDWKQFKISIHWQYISGKLIFCCYFNDMINQKVTDQKEKEWGKISIIEVNGVLQFLTRIFPSMSTIAIERLIRQKYTFTMPKKAE